MPAGHVLSLTDDLNVLFHVFQHFFFPEVCILFCLRQSITLHLFHFVSPFAFIFFKGLRNVRCRKLFAVCFIMYMICCGW
jgi:hypothetical protein